VIADRAVTLRRPFLRSHTELAVKLILIQVLSALLNADAKLLLDPAPGHVALQTFWFLLGLLSFGAKSQGDKSPDVHFPPAKSVSSQLASEKSAVNIPLPCCYFSIF